MALHEVQLKGYSVRPGNLSLGTFDSYGIEQLHVTLDDTWSGLAVTATFNPPEGEPVEIRVPENGLIDVPAEATANDGTGTIVYCGVANGAQRISKTQGYSVITHGNVGTTVPFNPSESLATQVLQAALSAEQSSAEAKSVADGLRSDANNGKFNGKDGAKGDKGDTGTTPQLKIGEDNLWHVSYDNGATWVSLGVKATGDTGAAGEDGLTPRIGENGNWWIGDTDTGVLAKGKKGDTGAKGADGVSPTVQVETIDGGHRVILTDASGAHAVDVLDGKPGKDAVVDATLTHDGQAADAKVTGEKIGQLKEDTAALQKRQNVLVGSESGNPVSCDDAFEAPLCGLHIYGKSTQDGTPTQDAPVPIVSAGDGGNVLVTLSDGNSNEQTLTLQTPTGLLGIPVTSGGNYTDQTGQQWVCDEIDFERRVRVQRIKHVNVSVLDKSLWLFRDDTGINVKSTRYNDTNFTIDFISGCPSMTTIFKSGTTNVVNTFRMVATIGFIYQFNLDAAVFPTVESWTNYLNKNDVDVIYALATAIETPLTADEIAAYKALTAYAPNTVVQASDGAGIKLDYQRDVNIAVKRIEDAIASMTTT